MGSDAVGWVDRADRERVAGVFDRLVGEPWSVVVTELRVTGQDGIVRWLEVTATNLLDDPDVRAVMATARDWALAAVAQREMEKKR